MWLQIYCVLYTYCYHIHYNSCTSVQRFFCMFIFSSIIHHFIAFWRSLKFIERSYIQYTFGCITTHQNLLLCAFKLRMDAGSPRQSGLTSHYKEILHTCLESRHCACSRARSRYITAFDSHFTLSANFMWVSELCASSYSKDYYQTLKVSVFSHHSSTTLKNIDWYCNRAFNPTFTITKFIYLTSSQLVLSSKIQIPVI